MLFHEPDQGFKRLTDCWKRATALGKPMPWWYEIFHKIDNHPLYIQFENLKAAIPCNEPPDLELMDWFALKVQQYALTHLLANDVIARDVLWQWKELMFLDPTKLQLKKGNNEAIQRLP